MTRVEINSKIILTCSDDLSTEEDLRDMVLFTEVMLNQMESIDIELTGTGKRCDVHTRFHFNQMDLQKLGSNKE
jgi:hypothetical protein